eukprot:CAMPEP_0119119944 /NCGR_PEP_ID=MMETSP1310-20130426/1215_1 /TAXON_ID=464262 /ORGANISM="Genus nov. species nov., Strain RCC2339" /LENGTH=230 /DNA_ID=CAMNT_0007109403 /DNA_START=68 /DNA_END=761 /DNA_ORIENTATION=-
MAGQVKTRRAMDEMASRTPSPTSSGGSSDSGRKRKRSESMDDSDHSDTTSDTRLTSRQKAMAGGDAELWALPMENGKKPRKLTSEEQQRRKQKAARRKRLKEEQMVAEKDAIIEKYSKMVSRKEQEDEDRRREQEGRLKRTRSTDVCYSSTLKGNFLSIAPQAVERFPALVAEGSPSHAPGAQPEPRGGGGAVMRCCVTTCQRKKKYFDSRTGKPLAAWSATVSSTANSL